MLDFQESAINRIEPSADVSAASCLLCIAHNHFEGGTFYILRVRPPNRRVRSPAESLKALGFALHTFGQVRSKCLFRCFPVAAPHLLQERIWTILSCSTCCCNTLGRSSRPTP